MKLVKISTHFVFILFQLVEQQLYGMVEPSAAGIVMRNNMVCIPISVMKEEFKNDYDLLTITYSFLPDSDKQVLMPYVQCEDNQWVFGQELFRVKDNVFVLHPENILQAVEHYYLSTTLFLYSLQVSIVTVIEFCKNKNISELNIAQLNFNNIDISLLYESIDKVYYLDSFFNTVIYSMNDIRNQETEQERLSAKLDQFSARLDQFFDRLDKVSDRLDQFFDRLDKVSDRLDKDRFNNDKKLKNSIKMAFLAFVIMMAHVDIFMLINRPVTIPIERDFFYLAMSHGLTGIVGYSGYLYINEVYQFKKLQAKSANL